MPSSTRSNKGNQLLFSEDPAHLERSIRKDLRSASIDRTALPSTDTHVQQSTDIQTAPSIDTVRRSTSFDTSNRISIDTTPRSMVAIVILTQGENGNLYD